MIKNKDNRLWQSEWRYRESILIVSGILIVGLALQMLYGSFDFYLLTWPINIYIALFLTALSIIFGVLARRKNSFSRWISGVPFSVSLIMALLFLTIIMGFTPQMVESNSLLGFDAMTSNWMFVLIYTFTILSLGTLNVRRLISFNYKDYAFYLNHVGLWLFLLASGLGYADMERYIMHVREGETEWRVYDYNENIKELPIAIHLKDFDMDVYPPKLVVIDRQSGEVQPQDNPHILQLDHDNPRALLNGWEVETLEYIHQAVRSSDSTYREVPMPGATPAARVRAKKDELIYEGWICGGNQAQVYMTLPLDEQYSIVMTTADPRTFVSEVEVYSEKGDTKAADIEVNKPLRLDNWTIYQYGYDNQAGRLSSYSSFELVYDAWLWPVYIGIIMMMLGSVGMIWTGRMRKEDSDDLE